MPVPPTTPDQNPPGRRTPRPLRTVALSSLLILAGAVLASCDDEVTPARPDYAARFEPVASPLPIRHVHDAAYPQLPAPRPAAASASPADSLAPAHDPLSVGAEQFGESAPTTAPTETVDTLDHGSESLAASAPLPHTFVVPAQSADLPAIDTDSASNLSDSAIAAKAEAHSEDLRKRHHMSRRANIPPPAPIPVIP